VDQPHGVAAPPLRFIEIYVAPHDVVPQFAVPRRPSVEPPFPSWCEMKPRSVAHLKVQFTFGAAILALIAVGTISYRAVIASSESDRWVQHTYEVLGNLSELLASVESL
jgi:hypothetical protein